MRNIEDEVSGIDPGIRSYYINKLTKNAPTQIKEKINLISRSDIKSFKTHAFIYPLAKVDKTTYVRAVASRSTSRSICQLYNQNTKFDYTFRLEHDANSAKMEPVNVLVASNKPTKKTRHYTKSAKRNHVSNLIKLEDLCFQPEAQAEYHVNVKPTDYTKYLNDPLRDPMFCQFDATYDSPNQKGDTSKFETDWSRIQVQKIA